MASELSLLVPEFRKKLSDALAVTLSKGLRLEPVITLLSPTDQASIWKQGRSGIDAELKVLALKNANAPFLAECLRKAVAKETNLVTDDLPGNSWHQWGEAATVVWIDTNNKVVISPEWKERFNDMNAYKVLREECEKIGLTVGKCFNTVQLRAVQNPLDVYSLEEIDTEMRRRFSR